MIRFVLPVSWMTSYFSSLAKVARRRCPAEAQCTCSLGLGYKMCTVMPVASQRMHGTTFRALKVTAQVTTLEVEPESAVCDYLVASCHRQCGASGLIKTIVQGLPGMERVVSYCLV